MHIPTSDLQGLQHTAMIVYRESMRIWSRLSGLERSRNMIPHILTGQSLRETEKVPQKGGMKRRQMAVRIDESR
jgi:hypothetical protein